MRKAISVLSIVGLIVGAAPALRAQGSAGAEQQVRDAITKFANAYGVNDLDTYFALYADDMTWFGPNGNRNEADGLKPKANYQKSYPESVKRSGGLASSKVTDLRVQVSPQGDAAIASYRLDVVRKNPAPEATPPRPANITYAMSAVLFKQGNDWKIVHFHYQNVPQPAKPAS